MKHTHAAPARVPFMAKALYYTSYLLVFGIVGITLYMAWPMLVARMGGSVQIPALVFPTAAVVRPQTAPAPFSGTIPVQADPIPGIAQNAATAQAMFDAAVRAAAPVPNVDTTNDSAPVMRQAKPAERQPAGENVPTAEPVQQWESGEIFGSKPVVVNPQETHECKHGQVWIEGKGCKNP